MLQSQQPVASNDSLAQQSSDNSTVSNSCPAITRLVRIDNITVELSSIRNFGDSSRLESNCTTIAAAEMLQIVNKNVIVFVLSALAAYTFLLNSNQKELLSLRRIYDFSKALASFRHDGANNKFEPAVGKQECHPQVANQSQGPLAFLGQLTAMSSAAASRAEPPVFNDHRELATSRQGQSINDQQLETSKPVAAKVDDLVLGRDVYSPEQLENLHYYLFNHSKFSSNLRLYELVKLAAEIKYHAFTYNDILLHRYDDELELELANGPEADQEQCLSILEELVKLAHRAVEGQKYEAKDYDILRMLDYFGHPPAGLLPANDIWLGSYEDCLDSRIQLDTNKMRSNKTRYCVASLRHKQWTTSGNKFETELVALRSAVCLPKSCDSRDYKNKFQLIERLIGFNFREIDKNQFRMSKLYCLPDEDSPLRNWTKSTGAVALVSFMTLWISFVIICTVLSSYKQQSDFLKSVSIEKNFQKLFTIRDLGSAQSQRNSINLSVVEGIKVLSMCYIIMGHILMCSTVTGKDARATAYTKAIPYLLANMIPAFMVNSFFLITGLITTMSIFKYQRTTQKRFFSNYANWLVIILRRYMRIMPLYVLVILYTKYLAKYEASGPLWDYSTSGLSQRRMCQQESIWLTLLFMANLKSPIEQCIPGAWYLANDFQLTLITPFLLTALHKSEHFGKLIIKLIIIASCYLSFTNIYSTPLSDFRPIASFMPHGFKTYVTFLHSNYIGLQYRVPAYLIGVLIGYRLFKYEQSGESDDTSSDEGKKTEQVKHSSNRWAIMFIILLLITPYVAAKITFTKWAARLTVAIILPLYHVLSSLSFGSYIFKSATGAIKPGKYLHNFLKLPLWKPLARLSLCAVLINIEMITYILQMLTELRQLTGPNLFCSNVICIMLIYLISVPIYLLFEVPFSAMVGLALNRLLSSGRSGSSNHKSNKAVNKPESIKSD